VSLLSIFRRHTKENTVTETTNAVAAEMPTDEVVMRFRTQGGATVELHRQDYRLRTRPDGVLLPNGETRVSHGFNWRCCGCGAIGGGGRYGLNERHYDEWRPEKSRNEANAHAEHCRALPRPTT
jgi:hypothetical protein